MVPSAKPAAIPFAKLPAVPVAPPVQQPGHPVPLPVMPSAKPAAIPSAKSAAIPSAKPVAIPSAKLPAVPIPPPVKPSVIPPPASAQASIQPPVHPLPSPVAPSAGPVGVPPPAPVPAGATVGPGAPLAEVGATAWPGAGEAMYLLRGPRGGRRICMTFDGGSTAEVAGDVLDVLKAHGIHTTLFLTGDFIRRFPALVLRIVQDGHEVGNHTQTHPHMAPHYQRDPRWTRERVQQELLDADRAFFRLTGRPMDPYWRPPFGEQTTELRRWAEELGYRTVGWSEGADTLDWTTVKEFNLYRNGSATIARLEKRMCKADGDGLIVLMHLGSLRPAADRPAKYLGPFMDRAMRDGWHFVSVGDYLQAMGKPRWDAARRVALLKALDAPEAPEAGGANRGVNASAP
jgi:peptidoglycan/xylan/chitin deacetylase (PgdA/CDA1 family)